MGTRLIVILLLTGLAGFGVILPARAQAVTAQLEPVAVVVNLSNPTSRLTLADLRKILAGEKHFWPGGLPVKIIARAQGCHEHVVLLKILGMSESEYKQYWAGQVNRGDASSEPVAVFSNGIAKEGVAAIPGAIALMEAKDVKPGIKVLKLEGRLPGDPAYTLQ